MAVPLLPPPTSRVPITLPNCSISGNFESCNVKTSISIPDLAARHPARSQTRIFIPNIICLNKKCVMDAEKDSRDNDDCFLSF